MTKVGAEMAASHTGSLAGIDKVWTATLSQTEATRVDNFEDMIDTAFAFQSFSHINGNRIGV